MHKIVNISIQEPYKIICSFANGEDRVLDLHDVLDSKIRYSEKVFSKDVFKEAKIGSFGEIYWSDIAEMRDLDGNMIPCEYDICPDYIYSNSSLVIK